jgi:hypothetical protein
MQGTGHAGSGVMATNPSWMVRAFGFTLKMPPRTCAEPNGSQRRRSHREGGPSLSGTQSVRWVLDASLVCCRPQPGLEPCGKRVRRVDYVGSRFRLGICMFVSCSHTQPRRARSTDTVQDTARRPHTTGQLAAVAWRGPCARPSRTKYLRPGSNHLLFADLLQVVPTSP